MQRHHHATDAMILSPQDSLLNAARNGDPAAFETLTQDCAQMAFRIVLRITKNHEDAEDVIQDALIRTFLHIAKFDGRSSFSTWFSRIAINSALMLLRKRKTACEISFDHHSDIPVDQISTLADHGFNPEQTCIANQHLSHLRQVIRRLPKSLRQTLEIRHNRDGSVQDVAKAMGISLGAAKSRLMRANNAVLASRKRGPSMPVWR